MGIIASRATYLLKWSELSLHLPNKKKSTISKLFRTGAGMFALGFCVWNMDNIFCDTLTRWKVIVGWPRAFLLEGMDVCFLPTLSYRLKPCSGHSWWHVLTVSISAISYFQC